MNLIQSYTFLCWQRIFLFFFLLVIYFKYSYEDVIDKWTREGTALIEEAKIVGGEIRQCTCAEQRACIIEMQDQAMSCVDTCWNMFSKITGHPEKLRKCFTRADAIIERFITCFENNVESCLPTYKDKKIPKVNITELFRLGVEKIEKTQAQLTKSLNGFF
ncbi:hypothetical protein Mgra_00001125 [Meloidogyne graminicola]|uniref:Chondroitin proteoglycan 4 domain-containing protein n=1 Tax=Meloidogyne graminicola TaxID=189291 RepID=A0A8T0A1K0_9BILA|nr:hypothetical protein Mgra_00001125 [Meloidogyne graminicola]